jgi:23S rRNA (adenine2503-C2)-methyltransferase
MTCEGFVRAASGVMKGRQAGAEAFYKRLFREGVVEGELADGGVARVEMPRIVRLEEEESPEGVVRKFVLRVGELDIESVLIPMIGRKGVRSYTLCVSSQVGCAMGCGFCETAQMGLLRSLDAHEIVAQWWTATHVLKERVSNMVFMGMGEPMDNLDNVLDAIAALTDHRGGAMAMSKITISTVGRVDGIRKLAARVEAPGWRRLGLALSLNAPNNEVRSALMPVNRKWNLEALRGALVEFPAHGGSKLCVEYVLIPGVNDRREHAAEVADFCRPIDEAYRRARRADGPGVEVDEGEPGGGTGGGVRGGGGGGGVRGVGSPRVLLNLIPYNPRRNSPWPAPKEEDVDAFLGWLGEEGVYAKRRRTKGRQMMGACGQLGSESIRNRKFVQVRVGE